MTESNYKRYKKSYQKYAREHRNEIKRNMLKWKKNNHKRYRQLADKHRNKSRFGGCRDKVLERDNWCCVRCGMNQEQYITIFGRGLSVHHVDSNGRNSEIKNNELSNLQTLCLRCHIASHSYLKGEKT